MHTFSNVTICMYTLCSMHQIVFWYVLIQWQIIVCTFEGHHFCTMHIILDGKPISHQSIYQYDSNDHYFRIIKRDCNLFTHRHHKIRDTSLYRDVNNCVFVRITYHLPDLQIANYMGRLKIIHNL